MANGLWRVRIDEEKLKRNLRKVLSQARAEADAASKKSAEGFARHLERNVPKEDGDLASTIRVEKVAGGYSVKIGDDAHPYAAALEFGHTLNGNHIPGRRFWLPLTKLYNKRWKGALRRGMKRVFKAFTQ